MARRRLDSNLKLGFSAFTLVELLVVIAIISLLTTILLPVFNAARERGRRAKCKSNLKQFSIGLETFKVNFDGLGTEAWKKLYANVSDDTVAEKHVGWIGQPAFLSVLYPQFVASRGLYLCPSDTQSGREGGKPKWWPGGPSQQFTEADDTDGNTARDDIKAMRNADIHACSYMYEFNWAECNRHADPPSTKASWWNPDGDNPLWPDKRQYSKIANEDDIVSWKEFKFTEMMGLVWESGAAATKEDQAYHGWVPMIRCFWHSKEDENVDDALVLNLGCGLSNVYGCMAKGDGWKERAGR